MLATIIAPGSRGDVQPYVALGRGLIEAGITVRLVSTKNHETLVQSNEVEFWPRARAGAETTGCLGRDAPECVHYCLCNRAVFVVCYRCPVYRERNGRCDVLCVE
jgi:hypothetical protein